MDKRITVCEFSGFDRVNEPVSMGFPFGKAELWSTDALKLCSPDGSSVPIQVIPLALWPDKSVKWALLDFQVSSEKNTTGEYFIDQRKDNLDKGKSDQLNVADKLDTIEITTGKACFVIDKHTFRPFSKVLIDSEQINDETLSNIEITDLNGNYFQPEIDNISTECSGPVHGVLKFDGYFGDEKRPFLRWIARIHFFSGKSGVRVDFTVWNPKPAKHPGGLWDLGDPGSVLFKDLSVKIGINNFEKAPSTNWIVDSSAQFQSFQGENLTIFQGSSGGDNFQSKNHINSKGEIPVVLNGFIVESDGDKILAGKRAEPVLHIGDDNKSISLCMKHFWQNFPKSLDTNRKSIKLSLFPEKFNDPYEIQGGERKTHTFYMNFNEGPDGALSNLNPLSIQTDPSYIRSTDVFPHLSVLSESEDRAYKELINGIIEGETSFFKRREIIDEYGWRNFGELYADHEAVGYAGDGPFISHYNNQYDFIYCAARKFASSADLRWFELMDDLACHVRDIDIYYTDKDRDEYNGGLFWHTNHYLDAATCTHRSESAAHLKYSDPRFCGGGPALEHNYTSGLMTHYFLTGEQASKEAVLSLADWVVTLMGRPLTFLAYLIKLKKKMALWKKVFAGKKVRHYPFPFTRESGNCITALLDAYTLTGNRKYIEKAEETIRGCVHPNDDIDNRDLFNTELNWSYTACLQGIGKYLDYKVTLDEFDDMFHYARISLIKYAQWMLEKEYPYLDKADDLEFPNETWPAQDMRKSSVFYHAAKYAPKTQKTEFIQKGDFYYHYSIQKVGSFETRSLTRPLVLLLQNSTLHQSFLEQPDLFEKFSEFQIHEIKFPDNVLTRFGLLKSFVYETIKHIVCFSLKKEIHWLKCKLNHHI